MKYLTILMTFVILLTGTAHADEASHRAAAQELFTVTGAEHATEDSMEALTKIQLDGLVTKFPCLKQRYGNLQTLIEQNLALDNFMDEIVDIYTRHLTEEDLRGLIAFYQTPLGQKSLKVMPQIVQESALLGQQQAQKPKFLNGLNAIVSNACPNLVKQP